MSGTTPVYSLPYSTGGDEPYGPTEDLALATALEDQLVRLDTLIATLQGGLTAQQNALTAHTGSLVAHGVSSALVGINDPQTLTGKTINGNQNTLTVLKSQIVGAPTGALVGTTDNQTLSGKVMSGSSNTFSNIPQSALILSDTVSHAFSMGGSWAIADGVANARKLLGDLVYIELRAQRTGADINGGTDGNIAGGNATVGTIPAGYRPVSQINVNWTSNQTDGGGYITSAGDFIIGSMNSNSAIATNHVVYMTALYMI